MATPLFLAIHLDGEGAHPAAWRAANHPPTALLTGKRIARIVTQAETAGFSIATFGGGHLPPGSAPNITARLDPVHQAAFAGPLTSRIGLVPEVQATFVEPFHTANQLSSIDHSSRGRGGWIITADGSAAAARTYGAGAIDDPDALRREAHDVLEVSRLLWDSWEDDAVIRDTTTWRYVDRDKLHYADFKGETFSVKGPSFVPRPPQGQLVVFGESDLVDPREVEVTIVHAPDLAGLKAAAQDAHVNGATRVSADLEVILDSRGVPAAERLQRLNAHAVWEQGANARLIGTADELIAAIGELADAVDIVRLIPAVIDTDLQELQFAVLRPLLRDGIITAPLAGATLRETLGLEHPANRFMAVAQEERSRNV
ncbi:MAG TPA: LLM class flavin-dependent oxidoreductase [Thermomicrobiales bacterium]|nr:LLM class flavin-dependent oxidoreductase [Thermomicrobiales bacterium]